MNRNRADRIDASSGLNNPMDVAGEPIAITGIGCRLPGGVTNPSQYWRLLTEGVDAIEEVPPDRWDQFKFYDRQPGRQGKIITRWGGFVRGIDQFDPEFFGISPREAASMDPQQRLVLETAWEALEDAGQPAEALAGADVGVFVGVSTFDYGLMQNTFSDVSGAGPYTNTGQALSICANRLSFVMDWKGPSFIVDTACSSSLLACHMAIQSIWRGESSLAMVSGVNFICAPSTYVGFTAMGMLSPDGRCKAFDASANGFVRAEGGCSVLLKPLSAALQDKDPIYALIAGSACNQDGQTPGLTMPSQSSQEKLVRRACRHARVEPGQIRYVEAHGTGTPVGDPIEINAIGRVIGSQRDATSPCYVGSVKANIGHLEAGSGIAGLIKTALVLKHQLAPPNLHFHQPNKEINFDALRLKVPTEVTPLPKGDGPAFAGVNSFGFGGTNVHLILQQHQTTETSHAVGSPTAVQQPQSPGEPGRELPFPVSARSIKSVRATAADYLQAFQPEGMWEAASLEDIFFTVTQRRSHHKHRAVLPAASKDQLKAKLQELIDDEDDTWVYPADGQPGGAQPLAFVFSGQGPQWWAMGRELLEQEPVFRQVVERCDATIQELGSWSLMEQLLCDEEATRINDTEFAQPAIFAIQVGLFELYKSWGIHPDIVVGHSVGEIAAAYAAGALTFEDAVKTIFHRGRTMSVVDSDGAMLAVSMPADEANRFVAAWEGKICLAAVNGPTSVTLSGHTSVLDEAEKLLAAEGKFVRKLQVNYAFHSHQMEPVQAALVESLADIKPQPATLPMISTVTGQAVDGAELTGDYWWRNVRQSVQFVEAMQQLMEQDYQVLLEISPHPVLAPAIGECFVGRQKKAHVVTSLRRGEPERQQLLQSLGKLYALQCNVDWTAFVKTGAFTGVPRYAWDKQTYWSESADSKVSRLPCKGHPILGERLPGSRLVFQGFMDVRAQPFAEDHKIQGHVLMPGTGFLETANALGQEIYGEGNYVTSDVQLMKAAFLPAKETLMSQTILDKRTGQFFIETQPLGQPDRPWTVHCTGVLRERPPVEPELFPRLEEVQQRCNNRLPANVFYDFFRRCGFPFGPSFKGLTQIQLGVGEMLGRVEVPAACDDFDDYLFHPALLDACLQGNFGCFMTHSREGKHLGDMEDRIRKAEIFMPSGYDEFRMYRKPPRRMWSYVRMHERYKDQSNSDVFIFDDEGELIAEVRGFKETLVGTVEGSAETGSGMLYQYQWQRAKHPHAAENRFSVPRLSPHDCQSGNGDNLQSFEQEREYLQELRECSLGLISQAMRNLGLCELEASDLSIDDLAADLAAPSRLAHVRSMLQILLDAGRLDKSAGQWKLIAGAHIAEYDSRLQQLFWDYPLWFARTALVDRCGRQFDTALTTDGDAAAVADSSSNMALLDQIQSVSPSRQKIEEVVARFIQRMLKPVQAGQSVQLVDLRGGSARLASTVLAKLPRRQIDYLFTDRDDAAFQFAREVLAAYPEVEYQEWNPQQGAEEPSPPLPACEIILADNASCEFEDWPATLKHLRSRLAPGGILVLIEQKKLDPIEALTADLTRPGASPHLPLNPAQQTAQLEAAGFHVTPCYESDENLEYILIAQRPVDESSPVAQVANEDDTVAALAVETTEDETASPENWLIFADQGSVARSIETAKAGSGVSTYTVLAGTQFGVSDGRHFTINPRGSDDWEQLLRSLDGEQPQKVLYLWNLDVPPGGSDPSFLSACQQQGIAAPVQFCQAWTKVHGPAPVQLWLVSRGAHAIDAASIARPEQHPLWGAGRVVMNEFPHFHCRLLDLGDDLQAELPGLLLEVDQPAADDEIALRGQARYVHRFVGSSLSQYADQGEEPGGAYRLHLSEYGTLDGMRLRPAELREPLDLPTLVEVEVHASALNFSDVMKALALYPGLPEGFVPVGIECAGVITRVGDEVADFKPGDEVVCITPMSISSHTYTDQRFVAHKPKHMTMAEAATLPIAFLTAHYALNYMGRLEKDETVLINAATGGVGLAALQLARQAGAEVFATAGSDIKRSLLKFLGVSHVMNSRTLAFADEVMEITGRRGVDVILNSLPGEAIGKGMSILADYGRFLEIGKRDIYANSPLGMRAFRKNVSFAAIDLDRGLREKPDLCAAMFRQIIADADEGKIKPLPHQVFSINKLVDAFRCMANARHIGKVIIEMKDKPVRPARDPAETDIQFHAGASYLITGGLGGLGVHLARWMAGHGAKCLVLASRRGVTCPEGEQLVRQLEESGVRVCVEQVDISDPQQVQQLVQRIKTSLPPLRGVMHAAAVLDDGLIMKLDEAAIKTVCAPKLQGAWHLHEATLDADLDFFVSHSSTSSIFGNAGQANYAAANAFLDGLAEHRRSIGLPALTVNWGYLGDIGLAAGDQKLAKKFEQQGIKAVPPADGLPVLSKLMSFDVESMSVMRVDWTRLKQLARTLAQSPRFEQMMQSSRGEDATGKSGSDIRNLILATDPEQREEVMLGVVRDKVARVMGTTASKVEIDRSLMDLGLDSLMGFELRNWIEGELRINIPVVELMQGPTVQKLTLLILTQLEKGDANDSQESSGPAAALLSAHMSRLDADPQQAAALAALIATAEDMKAELQGMDDPVELPGEVVLPADLASAIAQHQGQPVEVRPVSKVLLTGATGFLGAYILHHLLDTQADLEVTCLVRAASAEDGFERIRSNLQAYQLWRAELAGRIHIVPGDVSRDEFGMEHQVYLDLAASIDLVLHNAAGVNFLQSYEQLKQVNVTGTLNAMRFATQQRMKAYHHVSTLFVFSVLDHLELSTVRETDTPSRHEFIFGGYLQSKWVADQIVQSAREAGLPVAIYRPGIVTGDSQTGICSDDVISRSLASAIQLGCCPGDAMRFTFTPVDYAGKAIARLALRRDTPGGNYHLVNQDFIGWPEVTRWLAGLGHNVEALPYADWLERLRQRSRESADIMLSGLLPVIPEVRLSGQSIELPPPQFDCSLTLQRMEQENVSCPAVDQQLVRAYVEYLTGPASTQANSRAVT